MKTTRRYSVTLCTLLVLASVFGLSPEDASPDSSRSVYANYESAPRSADSEPITRQPETGMAKDLRLLRKTIADPQSGDRLSSPEAFQAAARIFSRVNFVGMTKEDVLWMLGDPATLNDYGIKPGAGEDDPLIYRFDRGGRGRCYILKFRDGRVTANPKPKKDSASQLQFQNGRAAQVVTKRIAANEVPTGKSKVHQQWVGSWEVSGELNRILGFDGGETRNDAISPHPSSFRLSLHKTIGEKINPLKLKAYHDIFRRIKQRIVATGKWETTFVGVDPGFGIDCYITERGGSTFLWCDAPFTAVFGGRVLFIQGIDREHDVIIIDFNTNPDNLAGKQRTPDTVAYKRAQK